MSEGIEKYLVSKSSERAAQHNIVNMFMEMTRKRLLTEQPRILEKIIFGIDKELRYWNEEIKKEKGPDLRIHLFKRTQLNPVMWRLIVRGFYSFKLKDDEYILSWPYLQEKEYPPSHVFKLHQIKHEHPLEYESRKPKRRTHAIIKVWNVQADTKMIAMDIVFLGMGVY